MSNETTNPAPGPRELIERSGMVTRRLSAIADIDFKTILRAKATNRWPAQERTRAALARALGLTEVPPRPAPAET